MSIRAAYLEKLSTRQGTGEFLDRCRLHGFQSAYKELLGLSRDGNRNPNYSDVKSLVQSCLKFDLCEEHKKVELPITSRIPDPGFSGKSFWKWCDNLCCVLEKTNKLRLRPSNTGLIRNLVDHNLISDKSLNWEKILIQCGRNDVCKEKFSKSEGKQKVVQRTIRHRYNWRQKHLQQWDGICQLTGLPVGEMFPREVAEALMETSHHNYSAVALGDGDRELNETSFVFSPAHKLYDHLERTTEGLSHSELARKVIELWDHSLATLVERAKLQNA